ncbi:DUF192 domain-containing protein [Shewanella sp. C32]|uniref:DUF192 domain-containing protein n=1 Tax=Shewanella electrica TaxID=515560 RepID=A0ABT2FPC5_9GAMM|nr:DUF192 domain-containing protein [Shewanella electrica]MCH1926570.1 DUF192 domain-containing protein [Shewanella electrica]MCS4558191.1 DUF192 domain-containing protein [Shewanella electrica]
MQLKSLYFDERALLNRVFLPHSFWQRARGLLGKPPLQIDEGFLFNDCRAIHMFGMRHMLDIVFVDGDLKICKLVPELSPWRMAYCANAEHTLELASGSIGRLELTLGQQLELR